MLSMMLGWRTPAAAAAVSVTEIVLDDIQLGMVTKSVSPDEWQRRNAFDQNLQESATTIIITVFFTSNEIGIVSLADKQGPTQTHTNTTFWPNCSLVESKVFPAEPPIAEQRHYHLHWAQTRTHTVYTHQKKKTKSTRALANFHHHNSSARSAGWKLC